MSHLQRFLLRSKKACHVAFAKIFFFPQIERDLCILQKEHCNTLQHTATYCNILQHTATHCNTLQHTATHCNALQRTATHCNALQRTTYLQRWILRSKKAYRKRLAYTPKRDCNTLQHNATHCSTLQHAATHCNILQHTTYLQRLTLG